ncbi:MAG: DUF4139 domain-containing protein [Planctomycetota bacterium]
MPRTPAARPSFTLLAAALLATPTLPPTAAGQADRDALPLERVTLYSSGVGYFEHAGAVSAGATPTFRFTDAQLNDVLKSLLVRGAQGNVAVAYPGQEPVNQRLAGFGIDLSRANALHKVLAQLRGVELTLTLSGNRTLTGPLIGVDTRQSFVEEDEIVEHLVTLATEVGLQRVDLDQVDVVRINDDALNAELQKALALLGSTRQRDAKPLTLTFADASDQVAVSYLLETPLWKLTYRLDLTQEQPLLQAWAIVDNTTDSDWEDVNISLVSGRPVSFVQNLYAPEYLKRPVVNPQRFAGLRPQEHALGRGVGQAGAMEMGTGFGAFADDESDLDPRRARMLQAVEADAVAVPASAGVTLANAFDVLGSQVAPAAAAADLGSLFAYHLDQPVTLERGASAMLPILNADIKAAPVSVYNQRAQAKHPMLGVSVRNTTALKLDAGPVTVLDDGAYAGDARLGFLAPGDARLLTYGLDLELTVDPTQTNRTQLVTAKVSRGVLELTHATQYTHTYEARNAAGSERQLLIEHPRHPQRELIEPRLPREGEDQARDASNLGVEKTSTAWRFPLAVPAGQTAKLTVVERQPHTQTVQLLRQNADQLAVHVRNGQMPQAVREALAEAVKRQRALEETDRQIAELEQRVADITNEQNRIRNNMSRLDRNNALYKRYVEKLDAQETQLENIGLAAEQLREQRGRQQQELNGYLESLELQ